jgi:hypothetical protein
MIEDDIAISIPLTDKDKQTISFHLFQLMRFNHCVCVEGEFMGELKLHDAKHNSVIYHIRLERTKIFKTRAILYDKHFKSIKEIMFDKTYNDINDKHFTETMNTLIEIIV